MSDSDFAPLDGKRRHKVAELEGALLDAAVAKALDLVPILGQPAGYFYWDDASVAGRPTPASGWFTPSTDWQHGGPIIERERIAIWRFGEYGPRLCWCALVGEVHGWDTGEIVASEPPYDRYPVAAPTPLIAAMRAFVASKLGPDVEL